MIENDNEFLSVGCIVRNGNKVLMVRHTYGNANGKLLIPGGYCKMGELPEETAVREVYEETGIASKINSVIGIRCCRKEWYLIMELEYVDGIPRSDNDENSEALFINIDEAIDRQDVTEMSKLMLAKVLSEKSEKFYFSEEYRKHKGKNYSMYR